MHNGLKPLGSLTAISSSGVRIKSENAPLRSPRRPGRFSQYSGLAIRCKIASLSLEVWNTAPLLLRDLLSDTALTNCPLCAIATGPLEYSATNDCAFCRSLLPTVE